LDDVLKLPDKLDTVGARALHESLLARVGTAVAIDAGSVERIGAVGVEVLVSGALQWAADGEAFRIVAASDAFRESCGGLGLDPDAFPAAANTTERDTA